AGSRAGTGRTLRRHRWSPSPRAGSRTPRATRRSPPSPVLGGGDHNFDRRGGRLLRELDIGRRGRSIAYLALRAPARPREHSFNRWRSYVVGAPRSFEVASPHGELRALWGNYRSADRAQGRRMQLFRTLYTQYTVRRKAPWRGSLPVGLPRQPPLP